MGPFLLHRLGIIIDYFEIVLLEIIGNNHCK
jgi:hypothetical protein